MPEMKPYMVFSESIEGCRIRVAFYFKELQRETDPVIRAEIAQHLAEAAVALAHLEAEAAAEG
jgi:hypothetical protein